MTRRPTRRPPAVRAAIDAQVHAMLATLPARPRPAARLKALAHLEMRDLVIRYGRPFGTPPSNSIAVMTAGPCCG